MSMKCLLLGYSGYAKIDAYDVIMTSFSLSINENVIQSNGAARILKNLDDSNSEDDSNRVFNRYKLNALRDFPGYDISLSFEANTTILDYFMKKMTSDFKSFINVKFYDDANGISYEFDKCFLNSFQLSVGNNAAASLSVGFVSYKNEIEIKYGDVDYTKKRDAPTGLVGDVLMPYWAWGVEYPVFDNGSLYEFSISYSRSITPKFGCQGIKDANAPFPMKIIVGVPEVKYELTYVVGVAAETSDFDIDSNGISINERDLKIKYNKKKTTSSSDSDNSDDTDNNDKFEFTLKNCYPDSYSPQYGNAGDVDKISISGTVYGKIEYTPKKEEEETKEETK